MSNKVNVAVIGCGYWGPNLIRNFRSLKTCDVRMVCDRDEKMRSRIGEMYPDLTTVPEFDDVLIDDEIDAVAIATPAHTHHTLAKAALESGKHVMIEKPMATSADECRDLIEVARRVDRKLMVGHTFIYSAPVQRIKEIVDAGELGDILYVSTQRLNLGLFQTHINVAWDLAPHDLSIVLHLLGQRPSAVHCQGKAHVNPNVADVTNMSIMFPGEQFAMVQSSWLDPVKVRRITVVGSKKMVLYDDTEPLEKVKIFDKRVEVPPHYATYAEFHYSYHYGDMHVPYLKQTEPLRAECDDFLESIRQNRTPKVTGEDGLRVVEILEAAEKSLLAGGQRLDFDAAPDGNDKQMHSQGVVLSDIAESFVKDGATGSISAG
jgi:predicted dehydrogenase